MFIFSLSMCLSLIMQDCLLAYLMHGFMLCVLCDAVRVHSVNRSIIKEMSDCSHVVENVNTAECFLLLAIIFQFNISCSYVFFSERSVCLEGGDFGTPRQQGLHVFFCFFFVEIYCISFPEHLWYGGFAACCRNCFARWTFVGRAVWNADSCAPLLPQFTIHTSFLMSVVVLAPDVFFLWALMASTSTKSLWTLSRGIMLGECLCVEGNICLERRGRCEDRLLVWLVVDSSARRAGDCVPGLSCPYRNTDNGQLNKTFPGPNWGSVDVMLREGRSIQDLPTSNTSLARWEASSKCLAKSVWKKGKQAM